LGPAQPPITDQVQILRSGANSAAEVTIALHEGPPAILTDRMPAGAGTAVSTDGLVRMGMPASQTTSASPDRALAQQK
jgi:hypothetical protein